MEEKRAYPRIKTRLGVELEKGMAAESVDLSEGGVSFNSRESITSPTISLRINFPEQGPEFKTEAKLVWKRDLQQGSSLYGVELVGLNESQKALLRKELIKIQISGFLGDIKDLEVKEDISRFFLRDMLDYISEIVKLLPYLSKEDRYSEEVEQKLERLNNQVLLKGYCLEELLSDKITAQKVKDSFRHLVGTWIYKSPILKRALDRPQGFAYDYRVLEHIYDNKPLSKSIGAYFDNYFLKSPYAVAVRMRKDRLKTFLEKFIQEARQNKINILNVACGSCREIRELLPNLKTQSRVIFTCLDADEEALRFSQDKLSQSPPKNIEFKFVKADIMHIVKDETSARPYGRQNLIYSIGLMDYLPDRILKKLTRGLFQLLEKSGKFILTHKNRDKTFPAIPFDWLCDWKFVGRNNNELTRLFYNCGFSKFSLSTDSDDFGCIYYYTLTKLNAN